MSDDFPSRAPRVPSYRRHKPTGQAVVTLNGRDIYLGKFGSKESRAEFDRLIGEWLAAGRSIPSPQADLTVAELAHRYWEFAKGYYVQDGKPTGSLDRVRVACRTLRQWYGHTRAIDFGPLALQAVQQRLADTIKRLFKWAVAQQLLPESIYRALTAVPGLKMGRTAAPDPEPIGPVADEVVNATLPHLSAAIAAMVQVQRLTGARPAEICILRPIDLDRSGPVWCYLPRSHKTRYRGKARAILIGPKAQEVLLPWLLREPETYCFVPRERVAKLNAKRKEDRKSPMTPSQAARRRKRKPRRAPGAHYTTQSYRQAILRAIDKANRDRAKKGEPALPRWCPNQLRHTAATEIRKGYGLECVQAVLGHSHMQVSEIYAEKNLALAAEVMRKIG